MSKLVVNESLIAFQKSQSSFEPLQSTSDWRWQNEFVLHCEALLECEYVTLALKWSKEKGITSDFPSVAANGSRRAFFAVNHLLKYSIGVWGFAHLASTISSAGKCTFLCTGAHLWLDKGTISSINHLPFAIQHSLYTIHHSAVTAHHLPFTIYHSPFTIYHTAHHIHNIHQSLELTSLALGSNFDLMRLCCQCPRLWVILLLVPKAGQEGREQTWRFDIGSTSRDVLDQVHSSEREIASVISWVSLFARVYTQPSHSLHSRPLILPRTLTLALTHTFIHRHSHTDKYTYSSRVSIEDVKNLLDTQAQWAINKNEDGRKVLDVQGEGFWSLLTIDAQSTG